MNDLLIVIAELGLELHPDRISTVASAIEKIDSVEQFAAIRQSFGPNVNQELVERFEQAWLSNNLTFPRDVAFALRGASAAAALRENRESMELVWTGPSTGKVPVRHTEQVLCEVIETARTDLFLVSFVAYEVDSIIQALRSAVERGVEIHILLESSTKHGGRLSHDSARLMNSNVSSINIYAWSSGMKPLLGELSGVVHAKCAVANRELAFITSANLTEAAMERNMELGILVRGGRLPKLLREHLDALIFMKIVEKV